MIKIRKNCFETNSSSTHSLILVNVEEFESLEVLDLSGSSIDNASSIAQLPIKTKLNDDKRFVNVDSEYKLESINVIVYEGTLNTIIEGGQTTKAKLYRSAVSNVDEAIGAVGTHESVHATSKKNIQQSIKNEIEKTNYDVEEMPLKAEYEYLFELIRRKYDVYKKHRDIINIPDVKM